MNHVLEAFRDYGFLFTILGGIVAALGLAFGIYKASHDKQARFLNDRIHGLEEDLAAAKAVGDPVILKDQNSQLLKDNGELQNKLGVAAADRQALQTRCGDLGAELTSATSTIKSEQVASRQKIDELSTTAH